MSVYCIVNQTVRLSDPTKKLRLNEPLAYSNKRAHAFRVTVLEEDSDEAADLTDVGCTAQFYKLKSDETVMPINGTVTGNVAEIILPASCYTTPGRFVFTMDLAVASTAGEGENDNSENRTVLWVEGVVERNQDGTVIDPGTPVGNITQAINSANAAANSATNAANAANTAAANAEAVAGAGIATVSETTMYLGISA